MKRSHLFDTINEVLVDHYVDNEDLANDLTDKLEADFNLVDEEDEEDEG